MKDSESSLQQHQLFPPALSRLTSQNLPAAGADQCCVHPRVSGDFCTAHLLVQIEACVCVPLHGTSYKQLTSLSSAYQARLKSRWQKAADADMTQRYRGTITQMPYTKT